ncbi:solute carrier family 22 member 7-like [Dermacentor andersoni]|uniref:solute carrier family 22 member 7-like n=1 Tax=Dermacentor andersoni TaxID=34620 RepID=UPI002155AC5C|nr:solute carrier family 22 member 7-like [Dermacentor andersoni]
MDLLFPKRLAGADLRTSESFDCEEGFGHGPFQKRTLLLLLLGVFSLNSQTAVVPLVTGDVDHWCKPLAGFNISAANWKNIAIPTEADGRFSRCRVYERCKLPVQPSSSSEDGKIGAGPAEAGWWYSRCFLGQRELDDTNDTLDAPCEEWDYDVRTAETSAVSYWNMVCHRRLLPAALVTLQNTGSVVSLTLLGAFVDYVGRRAMLVGSAVATVTCTLCTLVATSYASYAAARFFNGGSAAAYTIFTFLIPFEVMTHTHRPQQVLFLAVVSAAIGEIWKAIVKSVVVDWRLKQVIFLAPTAFLLPALSVARESPRWLVAKGRLNAAEAVMMQAAKTNNFPLATTACLVRKLREQVEKCTGQEGTDRDDLIDCHSLRRRALAMFFVCFCISFVYHVSAFTTARSGEFWIPGLTVVITLLTYAAMHFLMTGVALITVLTSCFVLTGIIQCALSIAAAAGLGTVSKVLLALSKGTSTVIFVHCHTYVLELFPSAVRGGAICWAFASGRVAATCASLTFILKPNAHEDVLFAVTGLLLFVCLRVIRALPRTTVVEEAKIVTRLASDSTRITVDHMKRTLVRQTQDNALKTTSADSSKSSGRKSRKSRTRIIPGSSKTSRGFCTDHMEK